MVLETETWVLAELTATGNVSYRSSQLIGQRNICMCITSGRLLSINISVYNHPYLYETQQELILLFPNLIHPIGIFPASCLCLPVNLAPAVRHLAPTIIHPSTWLFNAVERIALFRILNSYSTGKQFHQWQHRGCIWAYGLHSLAKLLRSAPIPPIPLFHTFAIHLDSPVTLHSPSLDYLTS